jgi:hypothetical protein
LALKRLNKAHVGTDKANLASSPHHITIETPYDDLIPQVDDPAVQFYLDTMRIYLGLCAGSVTMHAALKAVDVLKGNPEYTAFPTNPTRVPINERYRIKMLENLETLKKFNLYSVSALRSAYNFVFLVEDAPISGTDFSVLLALCKEPTISLVDASNLLELAPRTIARSLERLRERNNLRVASLIDYGAFNLQSVTLFFILQKGIEWEPLEQGLIVFPYTKSILKTAMTDVGYANFLIPNFRKNLPKFIGSVRATAKSLFEYSSIHVQTQSGAASNITQYSNNKWVLPEGLEKMLKPDETILPEDYPPLLNSTTPRTGLTMDDFMVVAETQLDIRAPPSKISDALSARGINIDSKRTSTITRKIQSRNLSLPYLVFSLPGLSSNFCFEIICNDYWKSNILSIIKKFPWVMYYLSSRGIIVWTLTAGDHQVEYYQLFRALEQQPGVSSVQAIMTISQRGSKSTLDVVRGMDYVDGQWSVEDESLDIGNYIDY